jgi:glycogen debranching enzyme
MWIWDSAFHALGLRHFAPEWARDSIKAVLSKQRSDGFIPITMTPDGSREADIVQPPILAWGAWKVYEIAGDEEFISYCYPLLSAMVLWDCEYLDADGNGLCEWDARNASGMDNSPRFDQPVGDAVDLNSYLVNDMAYLEKMAMLLGLEDDVRMWAEMHAARSVKINELLWDEETGFYYDLSPEGEKISIKTEAGFTPLFAGVCSREQAAALVKHLASPTEFRRTFPVSSVSADEPSFSDDMWRGPVWINYNRLIIEGLKKYGCRDMAESIRDATLREIAHWYECDGVIYEFYDSEGERSPSELHRKEKSGIQPDHWMRRCVRDYHWTAAIFIDLILDSGETGDL